MTVRREIVEPRRETGARSPEAPTRTNAVRGGVEGRARRSQQRIGDCSRIAHEYCGLGSEAWEERSQLKREAHVTADAKATGHGDHGTADLAVQYTQAIFT